MSLSLGNAANSYYSNCFSTSVSAALKTLAGKQRPAHAAASSYTPAKASKTSDDFSASLREEPKQAQQNSEGEPAWKREFMYLGGLPPFVAHVSATGHYSRSTAEDRGKLNSILVGYYEELKEQYGCSVDYQPFNGAMPEYDPAVEQEMKEKLHAKIDANPECLDLLRKIGAIYPPPERIDFDTMTTGNCNGSYIPRKGYDGY